MLRYVTLLFGVWACATAVIFIKLSQAPPVMLAALRLLVAAVALTPIFLRDLHRHKDSYGRRDLLLTIVPAVCLVLHFISWIIGARRANAANASLIVNLIPVAMPFFLYWTVREKLTRNEFVATAISVVGLIVLMGGDLHLDPEGFIGDMVCFVSMLLFAYYLALGRKNRHFDSIWLYVVPLYYIAGILCLIPGVILVEDWSVLATRHEVTMILCLGLIPTVFGHSILNYSMKHLRGQVVSIINVTQFIFAGVMAYVRLNEVPAKPFYIASVLLVTACVIAARKQRPSVEQPD